LGVISAFVMGAPAVAQDVPSYIENNGDGNTTQIQADGITFEGDRNDESQDNSTWECAESASCSGAEANGNQSNITSDIKSQNDNDNSAQSDNNSTINQDADTNGGNITGGALNQDASNRGGSLIQGPQNGGHFNQAQDGNQHLNQGQAGIQVLEQGSVTGGKQELDQNNSGNVRGGHSTSLSGTETNVDATGQSNNSAQQNANTSSGSGSASNSASTTNGGVIEGDSNTNNAHTGASTSRSTGGSNSLGAVNSNNVNNSRTQVGSSWNNIPNTVFRPFERGSVTGGVDARTGADGGTEVRGFVGITAPLGRTSRVLREQVQANTEAVETRTRIEFGTFCIQALMSGVRAPGCEGYELVEQQASSGVPQQEVNITPVPQPEPTPVVVEEEQGEGITPNVPGYAPRALW
jgi:hypothetical protein